MTNKQIRQLAYDCVRRLQSIYPSSWIDNKIVRTDWLQGFMERHKNFTLGKPENKSLYMATAFGKTNVMEFFCNYERALKSWNFIAGRVYKFDETGVSRVVLSPNIVAQIGKMRLDKLSRMNEELCLPYLCSSVLLTILYQQFSSSQEQYFMTH